MNTAEFLALSSTMVPERTAIADARGTTTYAELSRRVNGLARAFAAMGISRGTTVGTAAANSAEVVEAFYAAASLGAAFVPLNPRATPDELRYMINAADITTLLIDDVARERYESIEHELPGVSRVLSIGEPEAGRSALDQIRVASNEPVEVAGDVDDEPALLLFTSGTTSRPKLVSLTHRSLTGLVVNTQSPADPTRPQEVLLVSVGFHHVAGANPIVSAIFSGRALVVLPRFDASSWLQAVERFRVTHAFVVPTMLKRIVEADDLSGSDLSSLELVTYGAAPATFEVVRQAAEVFGPHAHDVGLMNVYGQTEATGAIAFLGPDDHRLDGTPEEDQLKLRRLRSVGRPMPDIELRICSDDGRPLPRGETGEIRIRGDRVMAGYHKSEEASKDAIVDGWLRTGDVGFLDDDGYLFITGRLRDLIIRGGENIAPAEVEEALRDHPGVADAAVVGVPDAEWGEIVKAFVVRAANSGVTEADLNEHLRHRIAPFKLPSIYAWCELLPRNEAGKLLRNELRT